MPAEKVGEPQESRRRRRLFGQKAEVEEVRPVVGKGRATPSRREEDDEDEDGNVITRTGSGLVEYWEGVKGELRKVAWPTREETRRLTIIVLITLVASAIILGLISAAFTELFRIGLGSPIILFAFMIIAVGGGLIFWRVNSRRSTTL
jgi:preprotein translocase subunit SecE